MRGPLELNYCCDYFASGTGQEELGILCSTEFNHVINLDGSDPSGGSCISHLRILAGLVEDQRGDDRMGNVFILDGGVGAGFCCGP